MKKIKIYLISSLCINVALLLILFISNKFPNEGKTRNQKDLAVNEIDYDIDSYKNFNSVFLNRNDSLYNFLFKDFMQNEPEQAFMMSCTYYQVTQDEKVLKDIETAKSQLESIYHGRIKVNIERNISGKQINSK